MSCYGGLLRPFWLKARRAKMTMPSPGRDLLSRISSTSDGQHTALPNSVCHMDEIGQPPSVWFTQIESTIDLDHYGLDPWIVVVLAIWHHCSRKWLIYANVPSHPSKCLDEGVRQISARMEIVGSNTNVRSRRT